MTEDDGFITIHPPVYGKSLVDQLYDLQGAMRSVSDLLDENRVAAGMSALMQAAADYQHNPHRRSHMTKGEYRVGIDFNPSASDMVGQIKRKAADLIDLIETIPSDGNMDAAIFAGAMHTGEISRLKALAQTEIESAAMWAVKAVTK